MPSSWHLAQKKLICMQYMYMFTSWLLAMPAKNLYVFNMCICSYVYIFDHCMNMYMYLFKSFTDLLVCTCTYMHWWKPFVVFLWISVHIHVYVLIKTGSSLDFTCYSVLLWFNLEYILSIYMYFISQNISLWCASIVFLWISFRKA